MKEFRSHLPIEEVIILSNTNAPFIGIGGGLCVFQRKGARILIMKNDSYFIELGDGDYMDPKSWRMFAVYASMDEKKMKDQWRKLRKRISYTDGKCLVI